MISFLPFWGLKVVVALDLYGGTESSQTSSKILICVLKLNEVLMDVE